jgi:hypothetical protein
MEAVLNMYDLCEGCEQIVSEVEGYYSEDDN